VLRTQDFIGEPALKRVRGGDIMGFAQRSAILILIALLCAGLAQATHASCPVANAAINNGTTGGAIGCNISSLFQFNNFATTGSGITPDTTSSDFGPDNLPTTSNTDGSNGIQFFGVGSLVTDGIGLRFKTIGSPDWDLETDDNADNMFFDSRIIYSVTNTSGLSVLAAHLTVTSLDVIGNLSGGTPYASTSTQGNGTAFSAGVTLLKEICPNATSFDAGCSGLIKLQLTFTAAGTHTASVGNTFLSPLANGTTFWVRDRLFVHYGANDDNRGFDLDSSSSQWLQNEFFLTPEPGTYILMGSALLGLGLYYRRRKPKS